MVVVIDVLRSFTVSAYALAGGARECRLVKTVAEARALADATPGALLCAEEDALPVEGIPISNSPTMILEQDLQGRVLIQRSTAGTQAVAAVQGGDIFASSLVVATATAQACVLRNPETLTIVASADHPEDHACARYIAAVIHGDHPDLDRLLRPLRESERYRRVLSGTWPGCPAHERKGDQCPPPIDRGGNQGRGRAKHEVQPAMPCVPRRNPQSRAPDVRDESDHRQGGQARQRAADHERGEPPGGRHRRQR